MILLSTPQVKEIQDSLLTGAVGCASQIPSRARGVGIHSAGRRGSEPGIGPVNAPSILRLDHQTPTLKGDHDMTALKTCKTWTEGFVVLLGCLVLTGVVLAPMSCGYSLGLGMLAALIGGPAVLAWAVLSMLTDKA